MKKKYKPQRICIGCREKKFKEELVRVVKTPEEEILLDTTGKLNGRGAYLCRDTACLEKAKQGRRLERSLSAQIPSEVYDHLEEGLKLGNQ